jgi:hypothetical protein
MSIKKTYRIDNVRIRMLVNNIENVKAHFFRWRARSQMLRG